MSTRVAVNVPSVAFKGPHDTDAGMFRAAAHGIEHGFKPGGSNLTTAVVKLLKSVASALEADPPAQILGFHVQCGICPQRALVAAQPNGEWLCPRCAEVAERVPVRLPAEFDTPSGLAAVLRHHGVRVEPDDEEYPLSKVRG